MQPREKEDVMTPMVAGTIAAHIGRRSELGASYGMNFRRYLIRADEAWHDCAHHTQSSAPAPSAACFRRRSERVRPSMRADHLASNAPSLHQARRRWETPNALHTRDTVSRQTSGVEMSTADVAKSTASHPTQQPLLHELAHALSPTEADDARLPLSYAEEEPVVESVAFTV
jgi:hypothetical protein